MFITQGLFSLLILDRKVGDMGGLKVVPGWYHSPFRTYLISYQARLHLVKPCDKYFQLFFGRYDKHYLHTLRGKCASSMKALIFSYCNQVIKGITALLVSASKLIQNDPFQMCTRLGAERRASIYLVLDAFWFSYSSYCNYCLECQDHQTFEGGTHFKLYNKKNISTQFYLGGRGFNNKNHTKRIF